MDIKENRPILKGFGALGSRRPVSVNAARAGFEWASADEIFGEKEIVIQL